MVIGEIICGFEENFQEILIALSDVIFYPYRLKAAFQKSVRTTKEMNKF